MTSTVIQKTLYLKASPAQVWAYLTDPEKLATWFHRPTAALTPGAYEMFGVDTGTRLMWGEVRVAEPFSLLEYTFTIAPMDGAISTVRWTLDEVPGGTRLSLVHDDLPAGVDAFGLTLALDKGWDDHLNKMRAGLHD